VRFEANKPSFVEEILLNVILKSWNHHYAIFYIPLIA
jgi:hypothetical protein